MAPPLLGCASLYPRRLDARGRERMQGGGMRHYGWRKNMKALRGGPATRIESRGLIAVRCGPPSGSNRIYRVIGIAEWRYV